MPERLAPSRAEELRLRVMAGLRRHPKQIPPSWFYDAAGAGLFEAICDTPEYYLTRTESALLERVAGEIARHTGPGRVVIEPGSGSSEKFMLLAEALVPSAYVPVEICAEALGEAVAKLTRRFPRLPVVPVCGDFFDGEAQALPGGRRLIFFPGSTIGNFEPPEAVACLRRLAALAGEGGALVIGIDLKKERGLVERAYNDAAGVTAAFNLNLLARCNRELGGEFDLDAFEHRAFFNPVEGRVEMHLVSRRAQRVRVGREVIAFGAGETIHTENSYKYHVDEFRALAARAGWASGAVWTDPGQLFSVHYCVVDSRNGA